MKRVSMHAWCKILIITCPILAERQPPIWLINSVVGDTEIWEFSLLHPSQKHIFFSTQPQQTVSLSPRHSKPWGQKLLFFIVCFINMPSAKLLPKTCHF
jgi:hypothetical protein